MTVGRFALDPGFKVFARDLRLSWPCVLRRAGLPDGLAVRGPTWLTVEEYYRLWEALAQEAGDRDLTLEVGTAISAEAFSPPILAASCSADLASAARRIAEYKPLIGPLRLEVERRPDGGLDVAFEWPEGPPVPPVLAASELVFWVALGRIATRHHIRPTTVTMPAGPRDRSALEGYLGTRVRGGSEYRVGFEAADATRPFLTTNETLWRVLAPELRRQLHELGAADSVAEQVVAVLHRSLPAGDASIGGVTQALATTPRTLQRQLAHEGTSFQQVLADTRRALATRYLDEPQLSTGDIAYLLGYADATSFHRAFRSWTGSTPDASRRRAGAALAGAPVSPGR
ncbi:AraC family transcriptional regulator [Intrasporangium flavum]|uniref:AraC family transcriptional regulator n=1 Tax=Intrasporangium flavum TaxID=1428657 RepID=UPI00096EEEA1|nr:AraC family transcriptional regulator [Intrasporangium flavum]